MTVEINKLEYGDIFKMSLDSDISFIKGSYVPRYGAFVCSFTEKDKTKNIPYRTQVYKL